MKQLFLILLTLSGLIVNAQDNVIMVNSQVYEYPSSRTSSVLMKGKTAHFDAMEFSVNFMNKLDKKSLHSTVNEQIVIIKEGKIKATLNGESKTIGANSVIVLMPGDKGELVAMSEKVSYYQMVYASDTMNVARGKEAGSEILDFDEIEFNEHDKGGIRNYFHRKTAICPYYEMHVTNLNAGIKSHEPHTHAAAEVVIMIKGETEMEIGNGIFQGQTGDVYYLASNIPHAIKNLGSEQCMYFAFQWD